MKIVLKVLQGADELVGGRFYAFETVYFVVAEYYSALLAGIFYHREFAQVFAYAFEVEPCSFLQCSRNAECCYNAGNGGVYAGI